MSIDYPEKILYNIHRRKYIGKELKLYDHT